MKRKNKRANMYSYGTFKKFIESTGPVTDSRLKYWAAKYFEIDHKTLYGIMKACVCTHFIGSHHWRLYPTDKFQVSINECLKKNCPCVKYTKNNIEYIEQQYDKKRLSL